MKRTKDDLGESKKGIKISLSEVYEVTFKVDTKYHKKGDKALVSLPLAEKFERQGKVGLREEDLKLVKDLRAQMK